MREGEDGYDIRVRWKGVEGIFKETYTTMLYVAAICRLNVTRRGLFLSSYFAGSVDSYILTKHCLLQTLHNNDVRRLRTCKRDNLATDIGIGVPA